MGWMSRAALPAALLIGLPSLSANAASFTRVTSPGMEIRVGSHAFWDAACRGGPAPVQIVEQPQHGRLSARTVAITITRVDYGSAPCLGHPIMARAVYYTPQAGFAGTDAFYYVSLTRKGAPIPHRGAILVR